MTVAAAFVIALYSGQAAAGKTIGLLVFSDEARFVRTAKGIKDTLEGAGLRSPRTRIIEENACGDKAKAAVLAEKFGLARMDLIFTIGTQATTAAALRIRDVPLVFAEVYDPVEAGIAKGWKDSRNNTTGAASKLPMPNVIECLRRFAPVKSLAVLYMPSEKNSEAVFKDLQGIEADYAIKIVPVPLVKKAEIEQFLPAALRSVDALYVTGSSLTGSEVSLIADMATRAGKISTSHLPDLIEGGVLLGLCPNPYLIGRAAGEKALRILKGVKPSSIPIDSPGKVNIILNMRTARAGGFRVPPDFMRTVGRTIE